MTGTNQLWWYVARSAGILAWSLLAASVLFGLALSTHVLGRRPRANWLLDLHRFLGGIAVVFVGVHVAAIVLDSYVHFGVTDVLIPFASSWHPAAVAGGVVALYLLAAVEISSLARARLSPRLWRATHYVSFPLFALATAHALTAGTDRHNLFLLSVVLLAVAVATALIFVRVLQAEHAVTALTPERVPALQSRPVRRKEWQ